MSLIGTPELLFLGVVGLVATIAAVVWVTTCWFLSAALGKVSPELRLLRPETVWLLLLPCVSLYGAFLVGVRIPRSLHAQLWGRQGLSNVGDCGEKLGIALAVSNLLVLVRPISLLAEVVTFVLGVVFVARMHQLAGQVAPSQPVSDVA